VHHSGRELFHRHAEEFGMNCATVYRALVLLAAMLLGAGTADAAMSAAEVEESVVLTARVKAALIADRMTRPRQIHIETYHGIIQLSGFVATNSEKMRAEKLAASVPGVVEVRNALQVRQHLADKGASPGSDRDPALAVDGVRQVRNDELQVAPAR
jgi:hyperosmotically inducible protein